MTKKINTSDNEQLLKPYYMTRTGIYDCARLLYAESEAEAIALVEHKTDPALDWDSLPKFNPKRVTVRCLNADILSVIDNVESLVDEWKYDYDYSLSDVEYELTQIINTIKSKHSETNCSSKRTAYHKTPETPEMSTRGDESLKKPYFTSWKGKFKATEIIYAESEADAIDILKHSKGSTLHRLDLRPQPKTAKTRLVDETMIRIANQVEYDASMWKFGYNFDIDRIKKDLNSVIGYIDEHYEELSDSAKANKAVKSTKGHPF